MSIKLNVALAVAAASCMTVGLGAASASAGVTPSPSPSYTHTQSPPPRPVPQSCDRTGRPITFAPTVNPNDVSPTDGLSSQPDLRTVTPSPTYTHTQTPPPVVNPLRCTPEQFVAQITALGSTVVQNRVIANGPVFGTGSLDLPAQTNTFDRALLPVFGRSVNIRHTGILPGAVSVNLPLCAVSVNELGVWRFSQRPGPVPQRHRQRHLPAHRPVGVPEHPGHLLAALHQGQPAPEPRHPALHQHPGVGHRPRPAMRN